MTSSLERVLLVSGPLPESPTGGRQMLSRLHHDVLRDEYGARLVVHELDIGSVTSWQTAKLASRGYLDGLDPHTADRLVALIAREGISKVLIDGSNLGVLARVIAMRAPRVVILTFCHNVEARFFWGAFRQRLALKAGLVTLANFVAEREAAKHSDVLICLNQRDSSYMRRLYGRHADAISPMALRDRASTEGFVESARHTGDFLLFVGGFFYANERGITWFARHVAPRLPLTTCVVGHGFEQISAQLETSRNVRVIGEVDSLAPWYGSAKMVVAPIFDGSGMKTKVAEALMFGKRVVGTSEAFTGYEEISPRVGRVCASADEFVDAILDVLEADPVPFDPAARRIYEDRYSETAARERLAEILRRATKRSVQRNSPWRARTPRKRPRGGTR